MKPRHDELRTARGDGAGTPTEASARSVHPSWYLSAIVVVIVAIGLSDQLLPQLQIMTVISTATYSIVCAVAPGHRLRIDHVLSPSNWLAMGWALQLVVIPAMVATWGPTELNIASPPEDRWMARALLLQVLAFIAYSIGRGIAVYSPSAVQIQKPRIEFVGILLAIGSVGLLTFFGGMEGVAAYFSGTVDAGGGGWIVRTIASTLATAGVLIVCASLCSGRKVPQATILGILLLLLGFGTSSYSRGMFVSAAVALVAVVSLRWKRIPLLVLALAATIVFSASLALGSYRSVYLLSESGASISSHQESRFGDPRLQAEMYMRGPQYLGVIPREVNQGHQLGVDNLLSSMLAPIPSLGEQYRDDATRIHFSVAVRGTTAYADLSPPVLGEIYWVFGYFGALVWYLGGRIIRTLDSRFYADDSPARAWVWMFCGVWMGYLLIGSIQVVIQTLVVAGLPVALVMLLSGKPKKVSTSPRSHSLHPRSERKLDRPTRLAPPSSQV